MKHSDLHRQSVVEIADRDLRHITAALQAGRIGVFEFEPQSNRAFWDQRVCELFGMPDPDVITYETVIAQVHPDDRALHDAGTARALDPEGDGHLDILFRMFPKDGQPMRWLRSQADCLFVDGVAVRLVGTVKDVTDEQAAIQRNQLLVNELEHRIKNTLATAVAIVGLSREGIRDVDAYFSAVDERLRALSSSHDVLRRVDWAPVVFDDLFAVAKQSFSGVKQNAGRISLTSDVISIPAQNVMTFSMGLHELFTNSAKHGALSTPDGRIEVSMRDQGDHRVFSWAEVDGPVPVEDASVRKGFGTILLQEILPAELKAKVTMDRGRDGLRYELRIPTPPAGGAV